MDWAISSPRISIPGILANVAGEEAIYHSSRRDGVAEGVLCFESIGCGGQEIWELGSWGVEECRVGGVSGTNSSL